MLLLGFSSAAAQAEQHSTPSLGFSHLCSSEAPMLLMGRHLLLSQAALVNLTAHSSILTKAASYCKRCLATQAVHVANCKAHFLSPSSLLCIAQACKRFQNSTDAEVPGALIARLGKLAISSLQGA